MIPVLRPLRVSVVVLAAGLSARMGGRHKMLLDVAGEPMIRRTVRAVLAIDPVETIVVTGHRAEAVETALAGLPIEFVRNPLFAEGQPSSVAAGVRALTRFCDAFMIVLGDQALLVPKDLRGLLAAYVRTDAGMSVLVPCHGGKRGNPVVFAARHVPEVCAGGLNIGCRHLIETHPDLVARVEMPSDVYVLDCDTPDDYAALVARVTKAAA
jgi:molybdenum cofactor cytidylyltransferase